MKKLVLVLCSMSMVLMMFAANVARADERCEVRMREAARIRAAQIAAAERAAALLELQAAEARRLAAAAELRRLQLDAAARERALLQARRRSVIVRP